jgi:acetyltransferase-like isoleucine patch superfamily enzyme
MNVSFFSFIYRILRKVNQKLIITALQPLAYIRLVGNGVSFNSTLICNGLPIVDVGRDATCRIGDHCTINSNIRFNQIGRYSPSFFIVRNQGRLTIGSHTGISSSAIICYNEITIGNYVNIGGNVVIYDSDFHSLDFKLRRNNEEDLKNAISKPVVIEDDVFVGAHSTILKGITIGKGAIIGAGSVITKNVPAYEVWGGNPAKFIRKLEI